MTIYLKRQMNSGLSIVIMDEVKISSKKTKLSLDEALKILEKPLTDTPTFIAFNTNYGIGIIDCKKDLQGVEDNIFPISREIMKEFSGIPNQINNNDKKLMNL